MVSHDRYWVQALAAVCGSRWVLTAAEKDKALILSPQVSCVSLSTAASRRDKLLFAFDSPEPSYSPATAPL